MQAIAEESTTASLLGINADLLCLTFFISSFLAGLAGTLVALSVVLPDHTSALALDLKV